MSELSANAVLHTASGHKAGSFHLVLAVSPRVVAVSVTDEGGAGTAPRIEQPDADAVHGRGLGMVSALAHRVVVHGTHGGYTITAELLANSRPGGRPC
ncbi:hypothetical protein GCM10010389_55100 [Streptomyces echinoruber]|uniref:Histidine kinase/HSP90-like ATPase domain-containing protein n=1 Tax=Streptomyces echinoruber TaxID=68898 RepID=A0A918RSG9_9ACTN|nr:hypothetical protein GCM10010389_55100 [Streptomyces echinoruber]